MGANAFVRSGARPSRRDEAYELLQSWSWAAARLGRGVEPLVERDAARTDPRTLALVEALLVDELAARVARVYEYGWEPRDLVHSASRSARLGAYAAALVVAQARATGGVDRAPQRWREQVEALTPPPHPWRPVSQVTGPPSSSGSGRTSSRW